MLMVFTRKKDYSFQFIHFKFSVSNFFALLKTFIYTGLFTMYRIICIKYKIEKYLSINLSVERVTIQNICL